LLGAAAELLPCAGRSLACAGAAAPLLAEPPRSEGRPRDAGAGRVGWWGLERGVPGVTPAGTETLEPRLAERSADVRCHRGALLRPAALSRDAVCLCCAGSRPAVCARRGVPEGLVHFCALKLW